jgi:hypothetical protein
VLEATLESQISLTELIESISVQIVQRTTKILSKSVKSAFLEMDMAFTRVTMENDYLGFVGRKSMLTSESRAYSSILSSLFSSQSDLSTPLDVTLVLSDLIADLQRVHLQSSIIEQLFAKIFGWLNATLFDAVLANKSNCCRVAAKQIIQNLNPLFEWIKDPRYVKLTVDDIQIFIDVFKPLLQLLKYLQMLTSFETAEEFRNAMNEFTELNYSVIHHAACLYRYESDEKSIDPTIEQTIQSGFNNEKRSEGVDIFKSKSFEYSGFKLQLNQNNSPQWSMVPHIPNSVIEMWLD